MSTKSGRTVRLLRFGPFQLDTRAGELLKDGQRIRLQEQPLRILSLLAERPGEVVLRDEISRRLWPNDTAVDIAHGINAAVQRLREALGETAEAPHFIETVARRGYRLRLESAAAAADPAPRPSARYRIGEKLGGGGMGIVYRAEDVKLARPVALKFLPAGEAADTMAVERFEREARAASALNHPNICTIYGIEEVAGEPAIVMELIEGETLEALIARGPFPPARVAAIGLQIASALDAAHRKGVVHRDLKPANILVDDDRVKVLDFGVAKIAGAEVTQEGAILGSPHYMSPEQLQGLPVDARSDIYSLGLVLYEMATGRRASAAPGLDGLPAAFDPIVRRCLAERPTGRWQTAADLRAALDAIDFAAPPPRKPPFAIRRRYWMGIAAAAVLLAAVLATGRKSPAEMRWRPIAQLSQTVLRGPGGLPMSRVSLSPDSRRLAFVAGNRLYIRGLDEAEAWAVPDSDGAGTPFWSPDGRYVAFTSHGALKAAEWNGKPWIVGAAHTNIAGAWGPDGTILIGNVGDGLFRMRANGGPIEQVTAPDPARAESRHLLPQFLGTDGQFLFVAGSPAPDKSILYASRLGSGERRAVMSIASGAAYAAGHLFYTRNSSLLARRFDPRRLEPAGPEFLIAAGVTSTPAVQASVHVADFSVTDAAIAYRTGDGVTVARNWSSLAP